MPRKKKEDFLQKLLKKAEEAKKTGVSLSKMAAQEAQTHGKTIKKIGSEKLSESFSAAKKFTGSQEEALKMLEKLGELRKEGILTEKEFQIKKKEILKRI